MNTQKLKRNDQRNQRNQHNQPASRQVASLLAAFRRQIEREAETSIDEFEPNAALFLYDLCKFSGLSQAQRARVLGPANRKVEAMLD